MTVEELLVKLHVEKDSWQKQYDEYYSEFKEIGKEMKEYYEDPFRHPDDIPTELMYKASEWHAKYQAAFNQYRNIHITIDTVENLMKEL